MRMKVLLVLSMLLSFSQLFASDSQSEYLDVLTKKTIDDFQKGIELYNKNKPAKAPPIKRAGGRKYKMKANTAEVSFTLVDYLSNQMFINGKLHSLKNFGVKKTSYLDVMISSAYAEDELDGPTTKIILTALGSLNYHLQEIGMMCFAGCQKEMKAQNISKILTTLNDQQTDCEQQKDAQEDSIKKFPSLKMVSYLHSTLNPEFGMVRLFMQRISEQSSRSVNLFMKNKLGMEKNYTSCIGVMTAGTVADDTVDSMSRGMMVLRAGGPSGEALEKAVEEAVNVCTKIDQLKSCLVDLKKNLATINSIKRNNKSPANDRYPAEELPSVKSITR